MQTYDIAIVGAGPAGMTAALYASRGGLSTVLLEGVSAGGQLAQTDRIDNYPGFPEGASGFDLAMSMMEQATRFGASYVNDQVVEIDIAATPHLIKTAGGTECAARALIVATGARSRLLGVDGESAYAGRGVSYCATCDGGFFRGKTVVVVGGGNTAAADAVYLSRLCEKVYVVHRRDALRATLADQRNMEAAGNIEFVWNSTVERIEGEEGKVSAVVVCDVNSGEQTRIETAAVFVAVGKVPNTEQFAGQLPLDETGYVVADEQGATSLAGVYAAGDVRTKRLRQVATAIGDGANAAEAAAEWLATC